MPQSNDQQETTLSAAIEGSASHANAPETFELAMQKDILDQTIRHAVRTAPMPMQPSGLAVLVAARIDESNAHATDDERSAWMIAIGVLMGVMVIGGALLAAPALIKSFSPLGSLSGAFLPFAVAIAAAIGVDQMFRKKRRSA